MPDLAGGRASIAMHVEEVLASTPFIDVHTHLFAPAFNGLGLWGIDELLTYHYLEAELFRFSPVRPEQYWALDKSQRADLIWQTLFVENAPLSEATRGVIAVLRALGLDTNAATLAQSREFFRAQSLEDYISHVFRLAGISTAVMTNDPLDPAEAACWTAGLPVDPRFVAALRLDRILNQWTEHAPVLASQGYAVDAGGGPKTLSETRRFVMTWAGRMKPAYMAVSLEDSFQFPANDMRTQLLSGAILPACRELNVPLSLMIGVRRQVNPALRLAGDASGQADLRALETICREYPRQPVSGQRPEPRESARAMRLRPEIQ